MYVNKRWCNPGLYVKEQCCPKNIELLEVSIRLYHLSREFSQVIVLTVYATNAAAARTFTPLSLSY